MNPWQARAIAKEGRYQHHCIKPNYIRHEGWGERRGWEKDLCAYRIAVEASGNGDLVCIAISDLQSCPRYLVFQIDLQIELRRLHTRERRLRRARVNALLIRNVTMSIDGRIFGGKVDIELLIPFAVADLEGNWPRATWNFSCFAAAANFSNDWNSVILHPRGTRGNSRSGAHPKVSQKLP